MLTCTNLGCRQNYNEIENNETACFYHDGNPLFHDIKKGWTCCNQYVYDWDEFTKLKGCKIGRHSDEKKEIKIQPSPNAPKNSVSENDNGIINSNDNNKVVVKDINEYEKEQQRIREEKEKNEIKNNEPLKNGEGKLFCSNSGCTSKVFNENENHDSACSYHKGIPVFHDLVKFWSCCKHHETWDWDEFMKIPTCQTGSHKPKFK